VPDKPILLVSSLADPAGTRIHDEVEKVLSLYPEHSGRFIHHRVEERLIYLDGSSLTFRAEFIIFLSRHASVDLRPILTVHVTGNFGSAEYGGTPNTLTPAATVMMHAILNRLNVEKPPGFEISYEATHHGPTWIPLPSCFVEVGSTEKQWHDLSAAAAVARAVVFAVPDYTIIPLAGFGGTHYAKRQTEITLTTRGAFGHIMPTRDLCHLTDAMFSDIVARSGAMAVYIDRKAISKKELHSIEQFARKSAIPVVGQSDLKAMNRLSFEEYIRIRELADTILPDSTITIHALDRADSPIPVPLPDVLIAETAKADMAGFMEGLSTLPVGHLSGKGMAVYSTFISNATNLLNISDDLINLCVSILHRNCDCRFDGDRLIIARERFDPDKARKYGIPAGPLMQHLVAGQTIEVNGTVISPEMVMSRTEKIICIPGRGTHEINC